MQVLGYGLGTERNALMHELFGEKLARTGQPPSPTHVAAVDKALAQRPLTTAEDRMRMEQRIKMVKRMQHIGPFLHNEMGVSWGGISPMCDCSSIHLQKI